MVDSVFRDFVLKSFKDDDGEAKAAGRNCGVEKSLVRVGASLSLYGTLTWRNHLVLWKYRQPLLYH